MRWLIASVLLVIVSCKQGVPGDIIRPQKMKQLQWDLMRADELVEFYKAKDSNYNAEEKRREYYSQIFKSRQTDAASFNKSLNYYTLHPELLNRVIDSMQVTASKATGTDAGAAPTAIVDDTSASKKVTKTPVDSLKPAADSLLRKKFRRRKLP